MISQIINSHHQDFCILEIPTKNRSLATGISANWFHSIKYTLLTTILAKAHLKMMFLFPNLACVRSLQGSLSLGIQSPSENANGTNQYYAVRVGGDDWHRKSSFENMTGFLGYSKIVFLLARFPLNFVQTNAEKCRETESWLKVFFAQDNI